MTAPTAVRALNVLRVLASAAGPLPASQVAERIGAPRASAYRLLGAMEAEGFVVRYPEERRWGLGLATFEVGSAYLRRQPLERHALPVLLRLVAQTRRTAHLGVLHGADTLYLLVQRPRTADPLVTAVGVRLPADRTASGRAILSHLPDEQVRAAFSRGEVDVRALQQELLTDRDRGWSVEEGLVTQGYGSVAAPVLDATGRPLAAISVTSADGLLALVPAVRRAAATLSQRLR